MSLKSAQIAFNKRMLWRKTHKKKPVFIVSINAEKKKG